MQRHLFRPFVGQCLNIADVGPCRVVSFSESYDCFLGGKDIKNTKLELISENDLREVGWSCGLATISQLERLGQNAT